MLKLVYDFPDEHLNVVDLPYRLSSWALDVPENVCLWEDENGTLAASAVVRTPWLSLDYALRPDAAGLESAIVARAVERCQQIADENGEHFPLFVRVRPERASLIGILENYEFRRNDWSLVHLTCTMARAVVPPPAFPSGFSVRPLRGLSEVADYVALHRAAFGSTSMTVEWRARTLDMADYVPELDLIVVTPDDKPVAFAIGWMYGTDAQVEPIGVHPDYQKLGLGRALLLEELQRMHAGGAERVHIESYTDNDPARGLYESVGFEVKHRLLSYLREF
jgi:ribosomal protein S18 acetylase RimI-like enzyme